MAVLAVLSRLPLLGRGYGSDDDAWRNMVAAIRMRELGHYVPSRAPGFPVFESLLAMIAPLGPLVTNGITALAGLVAVLLFHRLALRLEVRAPGWLTVGFAFCGSLWVGTTQTMDYAYGIAFVLAAYLALLDRRHAWAGVLLALAAGCRVTHGALILAALALLLARREPWHAWLALLGPFAAAVAAIFLPVALSPEIGDLRAQSAYHVSHAHLTAATAMPVVRAALVYVFGKAGLLVLLGALAAAALAALRTRAPEERLLPRARAPIAFELIAVVLVAGCFVLVPLELAYLLPAIPFVMLLAARGMSPRWVAAWAIVLAAEPLGSFDVAGHRLVPGRVFLERAQRGADLAETRTLAAVSPPERAVLVVGRFRIQRLVVLAPALERLPPAFAPFSGPGVALWRADRALGYAASLTRAQQDSLEQAGYRVADWPASDSLGGRQRSAP